MRSHMLLKKSDKDSVKITSDVLKKGGIVIIPTDTVYGFSGIAACTNKNGKTTDAVIREIKGRSETKPLIQLIAKPEDIRLYTDDEIPESLLSKWPGALTIIVNIKKSAPEYETLPTVAFRCPGDPWLRQIIGNCNCPIYSTSVNRSGQPVLDEVSAIVSEFENEVDLIIDDGHKKGAVPSTLVSIEANKVKVLRQGSVVI